MEHIRQYLQETLPGYMLPTGTFGQALVDLQKSLKRDFLVDPGFSLQDQPLFC